MLLKQPKNKQYSLPSVRAVPISRPFESRYVVRPMLSVRAVPRIRPFESRHVFVSAQQTAAAKTTTDMMMLLIFASLVDYAKARLPRTGFLNNRLPTEFANIRR